MELPELIKNLDLKINIENKTTSVIVEELIAEIENRKDLSFKDKNFIYHKLISNSDKIKSYKKVLTTSDLIDLLF